MKITDKFMGKIALPLIAVAGILLVSVIFTTAQDTNDESNAYIRVINCIVSYPATTRTSRDIETCYIIVEQDLGIKLKRYDSSN